MGHMTRYWRHVTKRKGSRELWNSTEGHGNFRKREIYIFTSQLLMKKSRFLASDFCVLVCFCLSSFFSFANMLVFWRIVLLPILYSHYSNSQQVWVACSSPPTFEIKSRRNLDMSSPNNQMTPWPGTGPDGLRYIVCFTPKHITIITPLNSNQKTNPEHI